MNNPSFVKIGSSSWADKIVSLVEEPELARNKMVGVRLPNGLMLAFPKEQKPEVGDKVKFFNLRYKQGYGRTAPTDTLSFAILKKAKRGIQTPP